MFFAIFEFFLKIYQNMGKKLGSNTHDLGHGFDKLTRVNPSQSNIFFSQYLYIKNIILNFSSLTIIARY
jgi:hypothetical protein